MDASGLAKTFEIVLGVVVLGSIGAPLARAQTATLIADLTTGESVPEHASAGTDVAFAITVTNLGPDPAVNAAIENGVPFGTAFVSIVQDSGAAFSCTTPEAGATVGAIKCTCPSLASGATATFRFVFHIDPDTSAGTFITSVGAVTTETFDPTDENNEGSATTQTPPPPAADLRVTKLAPGGANPDTDVTYTIELANGGPGAATDVTLEDTIPDDMTFVSMTQTSGPALSCSSGVGRVISCTVTTFAAGATASLTVVGHIPLGTSEGATYVNFVTVTSTYDPNTENDAATTLVCVQGNSCQAGPCNNNTAVACAAADSCHEAGTCNPVTGACTPPSPRSNGTACNDGNLCTQGDTCQVGVCTGGSPVVCPAPTQCQTQGTCAPLTGTCAPNPQKTDGAACDDGNLCTHGDACQVGVCTPGTLVLCPTGDSCHDQATCAPSTGVCPPSPRKADGTVCDDGNLCTRSDSCLGGICVGSGAPTCLAPDQCHLMGACDTSTGLCAPSLPRSNGASCDDGNPCTQVDTCQAGSCQGGPSPTCDDGNPCTVDSCDVGAGCRHVGVCDAGVDGASDGSPGADATVDGPSDGGLGGAGGGTGPGRGGAGGGIGLGGAAGVAGPGGAAGVSGLAGAAGVAGLAGAAGAAGAGGAAGSAGLAGAAGGAGRGGVAGVAGRGGVAAGGGRGGAAGGGPASGSSGEGCSCRTAGESGAPSPWLLLSGLGIGLVLRRRHRSRRPG